MRDQTFGMRPARRDRGTAIAALVAGLMFFPSAAGAVGVDGEKPQAARPYQVPPVKKVDGLPLVEQGGVRVTLGLRPAQEIPALEPTATRPRVGEEILLSLQILDSGSRMPLRGVRPAAWLLRRAPEAKPPSGEECLEMIRKLSSGALAAGSDVDLNRFYVFSLNADRSITVVDPLVSFSRTKLAGIMTLPADPSDWLQIPSRSEIWVAMPSRGSVARIDTRKRRIVGEADVGGRPWRLAVSDDGRRIWIGDESSGAITVLGAEDMSVSSRFPIGKGRVLVVSDREGGRVFAAASDRIAILDGGDPAVVAASDLPEPAAAMALSHLAGALLLASESGRVQIRDAGDAALRGEVRLQPGLSDIGVSPDGRWALAANRRGGSVDVLDVSSGSLTRTIQVEPEPERIVFTPQFAYVRSVASSRMALVQWTRLDEPGEVPVLTIPVGQNAPGESAGAFAGPPLQPVPAGGAVIAASQADRLLYYYMEGMSAPMGSYQNTSRVPLAVQIVDESLREDAPGLYATTAKFESGGTYDMPFVIDSPRMAACFEVTVSGSAAAGRSAAMLRATFQAPQEPIVHGRPVRLSFLLADAASGDPIRGLPDVGIMTFRPPGLFQSRLKAEERSDGFYEAEVIYPGAGEYLVLASCPSMGASFGDLGDARIKVVEPVTERSPEEDKP
jgi:hypothetical protein